MKIEDVLKSEKIGLEKQTVLNVLISQIEIAERINEVLKPFEISAEQFNVLRILRGQDKPTNMCVIQDRMIAKSSNTTRLVDKLLLKNMVIREVCSQNRRKIEVSITPEGLKILSQIDPKVDECEQMFANKLTNQELTTLNNLLEKYRS